FPNGVPAVSDASMSEWMLYVYKQFEQPMDITGLPIQIVAIDPSGEYITIGTTTSDASGRYSLEFTPTTTGKYIIYAFFSGSDSYYGSDAQNEIVVMAAAEPQATNNTPYELYTIAMGIAIILAVAIVGLLILKKK
ncbi:MAG: hypothetical protein FWG55_05145, partial [Candidatus Bathyarchaeota archaeon]|nr:hypothetical protein [Candidatus Termiticorpusculum sp.]